MVRSFHSFSVKLDAKRAFFGFWLRGIRGIHMSNDMTVKWNDLAWNDLTMERSDWIPLRLLAEFISFFLSYVM